MSNVRDRGVIDITLEEDGRYVLVILDDMKWEPATRQEHGRILQAKINDYLDYIVSGQAEEAKPGLRPVIRIIAKYSYSKFCIDFLERVRAFIKGKDDICDIEWTHSSEDGPFEDGFSDDFVFDKTKIYPRIKKNWANDPQNQLSLMPPDASAPDYPDQMVMIRVMDSFIGMLVQDMGSVLTYITYDSCLTGLMSWNCGTRPSIISAEIFTTDGVNPKSPAFTVFWQAGISKRKAYVLTMSGKTSRMT